MNTLLKINNKLKINTMFLRLYCEKKAIPKVPVGQEISSAQFQPENGHIHDRKPFKITLEESKMYAWCLCGKSKSQPLCDGTHKNVHLKLKLKPIKFKVTETKDYWLCNCKHTKNRPFCDGTHKKLP